MAKKIPRGFTEVTSENYKTIEDGAKVHINENYIKYWEGEKSLKYFVMEASDGIALIAHNKKMLNNGEGHLYSVWSIDSFKNPEW